MNHRPRRAVVQTLTGDVDHRGGQIQIDGVDGLIDVRRIDGDTYEATIDGRRFEVIVASGPDADWGWVDGRTFRWPLRPDAHTASAASDVAQAGSVASPIAATMPATVSQVAVTVGQRVSRGDVLVVLEAMKMEIPLRSPGEARVAAIRCAEGETVVPGVPLVELAEVDDSLATADE